MRSTTFVLTLLATLAASQTLVVYSDDACADEMESYTTSDSDNEQCVVVPAGVGSFQIENDATGCASEKSYNYFKIFDGLTCDGSGLSATCYQPCTALGEGTSLDSYLWDVYTDGVDPPKF